MILSKIESENVVALTKVWLDKAVIGLNLCPFAKAVQVKDQIRFAVSDASDSEMLLIDLASELDLLAGADPEQIDTTLLIHPHVLIDFLDYNDFLDLADAAIEELELDGQIQIASFHPDYQFAGSAPDDIENYTNRSPFPILHLLRESSIERAVAAFPDATDIYEKNIANLQRLGHAGWQALGITEPRSTNSPKDEK
ncbi:MAG TPA: DUF1415 domain-containing protein [Burkholderiaceae bacterium]|jgi:hypothetical protein|nr:DUF1415 domain-containing protein [Burkholderiaceae bacterium]